MTHPDREAPERIACVSCADGNTQARYVAHPKSTKDGSLIDWPVCRMHMEMAMCAGWFPITDLSDGSQIGAG